VEGEAVLEVSSDAATLEAEVNPRSDTSEEPTSYRFEYGPCATPTTCASSPYEASLPVPDAKLAPNYEPDPLSARPTGLSPHTPYHFRLFAENSHGHVEGEERTFTTQPTGPLSLPDQRAWEMVSPPDKHGASIAALDSGGVAQAAVDGNAMTYLATGPTEANPPGDSNLVQVLSTRNPSGLWSSRDIAAPHSAATGPSVGAGEEYRLFSADLSRAALQPFGPFEPSLSPEASEQTPFLRTDFPPGHPTEFCTSACYAPIVNAADATSGNSFGGGTCLAIFCGPDFLAATPDFAHLVIQSSAPLTAAPGDHGGVYEWSAGAPPAAALRYLGTGFEGGQGAISADGTRVVLHNFLRINATEEQSQIAGGECTEPAKACSLRLDALQGGSGQGPATPTFQLASADGSRVFFTDQQRLTPNSGAGGNGIGAGGARPDLYEYDLEKPAGQRLTDLTPANGEESAAVGGVFGAAEDGSAIYFAATGKLAAGAEAGAANLYLYRAGTTTFIASLGAEGGGVRVSPNGRFLAFQSQRPLTGYDNRDATSGKPDQEVFLYDAQAAQLRCVSCNPTGARPHGVEYTKIENRLTGGFRLFGRDQWIAAILPPSVTAGDASVSTSSYQPRYLSNGGRLFFNSPGALVPTDTNGNEDVYQYEPPKGSEGEPPADTCEESSPTYSSASAGCLDLISSGTSASESAFLDSSENGKDVFFLTAARLSPRDTDTSLDLYDARSGGGEPAVPPRPVECSGDACQAPAQAPNDPTPGSLGFHGAGNVREEGTPKPRCARGKVRRGGRCVAKKAHRKHRRHAKGRRR
jgi:hypothetical protein